MASILCLFGDTKIGVEMGIALVIFLGFMAATMCLIASHMTTPSVLGSNHANRIYCIMGIIVCLWYSLINGLLIWSLEMHETVLFNLFLVFKIIVAFVCGLIIVYNKTYHLNNVGSILPFLISICYVWLCDLYFCQVDHPACLRENRSTDTELLA